MSSWLTATLQSVREKSLDALDFVKRDLAEFTTTVKTDTESYLNKIKPPEGSTVGLDRLMPKWNTSGKSTQEDGIHLHTSPSFDRFQTELVRIQNDESTYLVDPNPIEPYHTWRETNDFNIETRKGEISQVLIDAPHVRAFYARLVPAETSHVDFWARYYYRVHHLEEEEARRTELIRRAHEICTRKNDDQDRNQANDWDEPDDQWSQSLPNDPPAPALVIATAFPELPAPDDSVEKTLPVTAEPEVKDTDEGSGDSWEHDFDESDMASSEPISTDASTSIAVTTDNETKEKKPSHELDDEWEAWS